MLIFNFKQDHMSHLLLSSNMQLMNDMLFVWMMRHEHWPP